MKKTYKIEVDCANCAQKMEDAANTVAGVEKATVSFMTQKMKVEFAEGADPHATMENVLSACKKVEDMFLTIRTLHFHYKMFHKSVWTQWINPIFFEI